MKILKSLMLASTILVAGCATNPDKVAATYISPITYQEYDCSQIGSEMNRVANQTTQLYYKLKKDRSSDKTKTWLGALLFWPTLFFIDGDSPQTAEFANLKGHFNALQENSVQKKCAIDVLSPEEIIEENFNKDKEAEKNKKS